MKILSIETSCDETAVSIIEAKNGLTKPFFKVLGNSLFSQIDIHKKYGGVFPSLAKREHSKNLVPLFENCLKQAKLLRLKKSDTQNPKSQFPISKKEDLKKILEREPELLKQFLEFIPTIKKPKIDAIAVTQGPGLEPALWVGINFAKALSLVWDIPVMPVNHMEGHIFSVLLNGKNELKVKSEKLKVTGVIPAKARIQVNLDPRLRGDDIKKCRFPAVALLISGGHTELVLIKNWMDYKIIGQTRDDAAGEAFDKVARMLSLPYPGGPEISRLADQSRKEISASVPARNVPFRYGRARQVSDKSASPSASSPRGVRVKSAFKFPRPMIHSGDYDFSFSGLKTAVLYAIKKIENLDQKTKQEIAREFEDAAVEVLAEKTKKAINDFDAKTLILGGGVTANKQIRKVFEEIAEKNPELNLFIPEAELSTDNALMIAVAAYFKIKKFGKPDKNLDFKALGNLKLG